MCLPMPLFSKEIQKRARLTVIFLWLFTLKIFSFSWILLNVVENYEIKGYLLILKILKQIDYLFPSPRGRRRSDSLKLFM